MRFASHCIAPFDEGQDPQARIVSRGLVYIHVHSWPPGFARRSGLFTACLEVDQGLAGAGAGFIRQQESYSRVSYDTIVLTSESLAR